LGYRSDFFSHPSGQAFPRITLVYNSFSRNTNAWLVYKLTYKQLATIKNGQNNVLANINCSFIALQSQWDETAVSPGRQEQGMRQLLKPVDQSSHECGN
jgi:hypothetical protein